jgi:DNA-binding CsgD family transcriptional regulator
LSLTDTADYQRRVELALRDAGLDAPVEDTIKLVTWSINQGDRLPWWQYHKRHIIRTEGGWLALHATVLGLALGYMVKTPDLRLPDAAQRAGDEYRASIRRQWDDGEARVKEPNSLDSMVSDWASTGEDGGDTEQDALDRIMFTYGDSADDVPPFDETTFTDPRIIAMWDIATEEQRDMLRLAAEGVPMQQIGSLLGGSESLGNNRKIALRKKLKAAGLLADGAAG